MDNTVNGGVFGDTSDYIKTYALIHAEECEFTRLAQLVSEQNGFFIDLNDGTGNGVIFNLSLENIIKISNDIGFDRFIFGSDPIPSSPSFYEMSITGNYLHTNLEPISSMEDLELIAPRCNSVWVDLYFNDYFKECIWSTL